MQDHATIVRMLEEGKSYAQIYARTGAYPPKISMIAATLFPEPRKSGRKKKAKKENESPAEFHARIVRQARAG